jgi:hypothetical protein
VDDAIDGRSAPGFAGSVGVGLGACVLPALFGAGGALMGSAYAGLAAAAVVAVAFSALWVRQLGRRDLWVAALVGTMFAAMVAFMFAPALRAVTGRVPSLGLASARQEDGVFHLQELARTSQLYVGVPTKVRISSGHYVDDFPVVAPLAPASWKGASPVPAWGFCLSRQDNAGQRAQAEQECRRWFARGGGLWQAPSHIAHPNDSISLPELVDKASQARGLVQKAGAPVFERFPVSDYYENVFMPLVVLLITALGVGIASRRPTRTGP